MLLKILNIAEKAPQVQKLIDNFTDWRRYEKREIRDELSAIIEE